MVLRFSLVLPGILILKAKVEAPMKILDEIRAYNGKLNYISEHYAAIARKSHIFRDEHIMDRAKENLEIIGKFYDYE